MKKYKALKTNRLPFSWCPGCGINIVTMHLAKYFEDNDFTNKNTSIISGIGCSGRFAGYFNMDTMHTTHGRAIPIAEGLKLSNPKLNIVVVSGDGDLLSIGLSHLIHTARRNTNIKVICLNNSIYAMTGGQTSPSTPKNKITTTSPQGNPFKFINAYEIVCKPFNRLYARLTPLTKKLFYKALDFAFKTTNFSFIEIVFPCYENDLRRYGGKNPMNALRTFSKAYSEKGITNKLENKQLGIIKNYE